jgi:pyridoxal biosynthesis lyase PdxS
MLCSIGRRRRRAHWLRSNEHPHPGLCRKYRSHSLTAAPESHFKPLQDAVKGHKSPLTGKPVFVVAAGGISDGRGLAAALMWGAQGVWVGTRFVASEEAGAPKMHKDL